MPVFAAAGVPLTLKNAPTNLITLEAGQVWYPGNFISPSVPGKGVGVGGEQWLRPSRYAALQVLDPVTQIWRGIGDDTNADRIFRANSGNIRIANQSGCAVAAVVTQAGANYTSAPLVTASAGSSVWRAILGPVVNTTVTVSYGGTNYTYPPIVVIDAPPPGGVQATGYSTLTSNAVSSVTITDQGAGYSGGVPNIYLMNDPRDTAGSGATAVLTLTGSGTVAAVVATDHGNPITSGTGPTLSFSGGAGVSAAATALMNWGITTYAVTTAGAGYGNSGIAEITAVGPAVIASPAYTNPAIQQKLVRVRKAAIWAPTNSTGGLTTGGEIVDGGVYAGIPTASLSTQGALITTAGVVTLTMGGFNDSVWVQSF